MNIQFLTSDIDAVRRVLAAGCKWVRFVPTEGDEATAAEAVRLCREQDAVIVIEDDAALCEAVKADGVHLNDATLVGSVRRTLGEEPLIGVTVGGFDEAKTARAGGADYLDAGLFEHTTPEALRELVRALYEADYPLPVSVSGAVTPDDLPTISAAGVRGVATASEGFFRNDIWDLLDTLS